MSNPNRERELIHAPVTFEDLQRRAADGWRIHAIEWERRTASVISPERREELPYEMRVAEDCHHLEEDPGEVETMMVMMEGIVQDRALSQIAADLTRRGFLTRDGRPWSQVAVFNLLPRFIDFSPRFLNRTDWIDRRRGLKLVV